MFRKKGVFKDSQRWMIMRDIKRYEERSGILVETKEDLLYFLFGDSESRADTSLDIQIFRDNVESTITHRLNRLWAYPFTLLCAPFMYIFKGEIGWDGKSGFSKWLLTVTGYIKDDKLD